MMKNRLKRLESKLKEIEANKPKMTDEEKKEFADKIHKQLLVLRVNLGKEKFEERLKLIEAKHNISLKSYYNL